MFSQFQALFKKRDLLVPSVSESWSLDEPLLPLGKGDRFTIGNAVENVLIVGGIGSGKTSASGRAFALSFLSSGFGGLILCAKPEEPALWRLYAELSGRLSDLVEFGPGSDYRFDPLAFELAHPGPGGRHTENLVQLFMTLMDLGERNGGGGGGKENEAYWRKAILQLLRNLVDLVILATNGLAVSDMYRVAVSIATSLEEVKSADWRSRSACFKSLVEAEKRPKTAGQQRDFELVADYFLCELPALSDKTRSVILSTFTSMIDVLQRGALRDLFTQGCNIDPTAIEQGKIIVVAMPLKEYGQVGLYAAALWKYAFQKSIERRDMTANSRPVVLWADEGQFFLLQSTDMLFTSTARSSRVCNVLLTQSISGVIATLGGGPAGKAEADAYLSNYGTKVFHANTDAVSNDYASMLIGRCKQFVVNSSNSYQNPTQGFGPRQMTGGSSGLTEVFELEVQAREFSKLRCGGAPNSGFVDAIVFRNGARFRGSNRNWMKVSFKQELQRGLR